MARATEKTTERTFVKKTRDRGELTRIVTTPKSEVEARFDGFHEQTATKPAAGSTSSSGSSGTTGKAGSSS